MNQQDETYQSKFLMFNVFECVYHLLIHKTGTDYNKSIWKSLVSEYI